MVIGQQIDNSISLLLATSGLVIHSQTSAAAIEITGNWMKRARLPKRMLLAGGGVEFKVSLKLIFINMGDFN